MKLSKNKLNLFALAALLLALGLSACKPSVEGETKSWDTNLAMLTTMKTDEPQFADAIAELETAATAEWEKAAGISDEEAKAEQMRIANDLIDDSFAGMISDIRSMEKEIERYEDKLYGKRMSRSLANRLEDASEDATDALIYADDAIARGANSMTAANSLIQAAYDKVKRVKNEFSSIDSKYKSEKRKKKKR